MLLQMALFHLFMAECYSCVCVCVCVRTRISHILIHSSLDGHLGCFHVPATVTNAEVNTNFFKLEFSLFLCPGMGLLDHTANLF